VRALGDATSAFTVDGPRIDTDLLSGVAAACRDQSRLRFAYVAKDGRASQRVTDPTALVHSGRHWYLVAFDLDRDDWRTFRLDRIRGRVRPGERRRPRTVPGGDPAAYVRQQLRSGAGAETEAPHGRIRVTVAAERVRGRIPERYASVEADGPEACIVTSARAWSHEFLVWMALLDLPIEVLEPPELIDAARALATRLADAA
jgi:predicted DNA-binding transcriptional regulator YafY